MQSSSVQSVAVAVALLLVDELKLLFLDDLYGGLRDNFNFNTLVELFMTKQYSICLKRHMPYCYVEAPTSN
jgi:hypothetical protein